MAARKRPASVLLVGCAITAVIGVCAPAPVTGDDTSANPGLVEALDAIVREACEYWTDQQYARMHEMLVEHVGGAGLRTLGDEEREALLASFRGRVERLWRLEEASLEFRLALANLAWRLDCMFQRETPGAQQLAEVCGQVNALVEELSDVARSWAGVPLKWFIDEIVQQAQRETETAVRDPLSPALKRILSSDEVREISQQAREKWADELPRLEDRLNWIAGQEQPNVKSLQAMACENALRSHLTSIRGLAGQRTLPPPPSELLELQRKLGQQRRLDRERQQARAETGSDPKEAFLQRAREAYRPRVRDSGLAIMALELAFLLNWCQGGDATFVP